MSLASSLLRACFKPASNLPPSRLEAYLYAMDMAPKVPTDIGPDRLAVVDLTGRGIGCLAIHSASSLAQRRKVVRFQVS